MRSKKVGWLSTQTHHFVVFLNQQIHDEDGFLVRKLGLPMEGII